MSLTRWREDIWELTHLRRVAEKFGYILVCSNNAKNAMPWQHLFEIISIQAEDVESRFRINPKRMYASGFSGGSRLASAMAMVTGNICAVIGCGAGFSNQFLPDKNMNFDYIGIVSNADMNYREMQQLHQQLDSLNLHNQSIYYDGGHSWPSSNAIQQAFEWLELRAMQKKLKPVSNDFIEKMWKSYKHTLPEEIKGIDMFLYNHYVQQKRIQNFKGFKNTDSLSYIVELQTTGARYMMLYQKEDEFKTKEDLWQSKYVQAFNQIHLADVSENISVQNNEWWQQEFDLIKQLVDNVKEEATSYMGKRLKDFVWRNAYESHAAYARQQKWQTAERFAYIVYTFVPDKPFPCYILAGLNMRQGKNKTGLYFLRTSRSKRIFQYRLFESRQGF